MENKVSTRLPRECSRPLGSQRLGLKPCQLAKVIHRTMVRSWSKYSIPTSSRILHPDHRRTTSPNLRVCTENILPPAHVCLALPSGRMSMTPPDHHSDPNRVLVSSPPDQCSLLPLPTPWGSLACPGGLSLSTRDTVMWFGMWSRGSRGAR